MERKVARQSGGTTKERLNRAQFKPEGRNNLEKKKGLELPRWSPARQVLAGRNQMEKIRQNDAPGGGH